MKNTSIDEVESVFITDSDIRHIKKHHSSNEDARGQIDLTPDDFALLPVVINEYDELCVTDTDKLGNKRFEISKEIDGLIIVAAVQRGKRRMEVRSFWKMKMSGASC